MDPSQTSGDSELFRQQIRKRSSPVPALLLCLAGLAATGFAVFKVRQAEDERILERFGRVVHADRSLIYSVVSRHESALFSLRLLFTTSERITREEFRLAAQELRPRNPSISALEWIPRVPGADRERFEAEVRADGAPGFFISDGGPGEPAVRAAARPEHWPIVFAEPAAENSGVLGYDLAGGPTVADIQAARDTGKTRLTAPLKLRQETTGRMSLIAILPVYDAKKPIGTVAERQAAFRGVVEGITRLQDFFADVYEDRRDLPYTLTVSMAEEPEKPIFGLGDSRWKNRGPIRLVQPFNIGERWWNFEFVATPEWIARGRSSAAWWTLAAGLLGTALIGGGTLSSARRAKQIEAQVERRTRQLNEANRQLEQQAAERRQVEAALRQSEQKLTEAQRIARLGRWESDLVTGRLVWSEETFRIFGLSAGSFVPTTEEFYARVHPDDLALVREQVRRAREQGTPYQLVHRIVWPDGTIRHVQENAELVRAGSGPGRLVGTVLDITERREVEEALAKERNLLRTLIDAIPDPIAVKDRSGRFLLLNRANAAALGLQHPAEAVGRTDADFQPLAEADRQSLDDRAVIESGQPILSREEYVSNGAAGWYLTTKIPLRDDREEITGLISISRNITERRRIQAELQREHAFLRTLIDTLPDFVYVKDLDGRYLLTNRANLRLLGLPTVESAIGKSVRDLFPPEIATLYEEDDRRVIAGESVLNREHPAQFPDGSRGFILTTKVPIRDSDGRVTAVFGVSRDVTDLHRMQREREEMHRRLNHSQKLESLGELAGGVAHDFNNILTVILNNAILAKMHPGDIDLRRECLEQIEHAAARAAYLCNQMLAYSGRGQFVVEPVRLRELVDDTLPLVRSSISRRADLEIVAEPCDAVTQADVTQIRQIILNLVINASDALGNEPGRIRIVTGLMTADGDYLKTCALAPEGSAGQFVFLEVSDTGCGMSPETMARIFEPFFSTKFTGRGLGLAAVLGIVRGHRGAIRVESGLGRGTTFRLLLPATFGIEPRPLAGPAKPVTKSSHTGRVLVVDDEDRVRSVICRSIEKAGYTAVPASNGQEALEILGERHREFAVVLLDLTMPGMDGQQVFEAVRAINGQLPVLLMSGFSESEATAKFAGQGLAGFIQKPFEVSALVEQLSRVIQSGRG